MTATRAQNAASLGNLGARASAIADELRKLRERLGLNREGDEITFAAAVAAARHCSVSCRELEKRIKKPSEGSGA